MLTCLDLFSGIGGFSLGLEWTAAGRATAMVLALVEKSKEVEEPKP